MVESVLTDEIPKALSAEPFLHSHSSEIVKKSLEVG